MEHKNKTMITIKTIKTIHPAVPELKREAKTVYYLIISNGKQPEAVINVGAKTYEFVSEIVNNDIKKEK